MELNNSNTWKNLLTAWTGETQAHSKYLLFSEKASEDGYKHISEIFKLAAKNELAHSKVFYEYLISGMPTTTEALLNSKDTEKFESTDLYPGFAEEAEKEGFGEIADKFRNIAKIENNHMIIFDRLIRQMNEDKVFKSDQTSKWVCMNCGNICSSEEAPAICPVCGKPQSWFSCEE